MGKTTPQGSDRRLVAVTFKLPAADLERIDQLADSDDRPLSYLLRAAVRDYLAARAAA
jgi:predicted transcriptional regulator